MINITKNGIIEIDQKHLRRAKTYTRAMISLDAPWLKIQLVQVPNCYNVHIRHTTKTAQVLATDFIMQTGIMGRFETTRSADDLILIDLRKKL